MKVPVGGVEEGQTFSVPFPAGSNDYSGAAIPRSSVPVGHWKVGEQNSCNCFARRLNLVMLLTDVAFCQLG